MHSPRFARLSSLFALIVCLAAAGGWHLVTGAEAAQRVVKASNAWVKAPAAAGAPALAFVTVENGTMYDVYLVGASAKGAEKTEVRTTAASAAAPMVTAEVPIPAYGQLEMTEKAIHLALVGLSAPLKAGDTVALTLFLDNGDRVEVAATVK